MYAHIIYIYIIKIYLILINYNLHFTHVYTCTVILYNNTYMYSRVPYSVPIINYK